MTDHIFSIRQRYRFIRYRFINSRFTPGFTLVEILVVLSLLGIMLGLIAVNFSTDEREQLQQENHRLALLLTYAGELARSSGQPLAFIPGKQGYAFMSRTPSRWQAVSGDQALRQRRFPDGITILSSSVEGQRLKANEMLVLSPTGLNAPFRLVLASERFIAAINGNMLGQIREEAVADFAVAHTSSKEIR